MGFLIYVWEKKKKKTGKNVIFLNSRVTDEKEKNKKDWANFHIARFVHFRHEKRGENYFHYLR